MLIAAASLVGVSVFWLSVICNVGGWCVENDVSMRTELSVRADRLVFDTLSVLRELSVAKVDSVVNVVFVWIVEFS